VKIPFPIYRAWTVIIMGHSQRKDELFALVKHKKRR
jgi:hypothetical protein